MYKTKSPQSTGTNFITMIEKFVNVGKVFHLQNQQHFSKAAKTHDNNWLLKNKRPFHEHCAHREKEAPAPSKAKAKAKALKAKKAELKGVKRNTQRTSACHRPFPGPTLWLRRQHKSPPPGDTGFTNCHHRVLLSMREP